MVSESVFGNESRTHTLTLGKFGNAGEGGGVWSLALTLRQGIVHVKEVITLQYGVNL